MCPWGRERHGQRRPPAQGSRPGRPDPRAAAAQPSAPQGSQGHHGVQTPPGSIWSETRNLQLAPQVVLMKTSLRRAGTPAQHLAAPSHCSLVGRAGPDSAGAGVQQAPGDACRPGCAPSLRDASRGSPGDPAGHCDTRAALGLARPSCPGPCRDDLALASVKGDRPGPFSLRGRLA